MAEHLTSPEAPAALAPVPADPAPVSMRPHRPRFIMVYGVLAAVLGVSVALVVLYAGRAMTPAAKWSPWKPSGGGLGAAKQIADQVGKAYRLPNGDQLVDVIAKAPSIPGQGGAPVPIHYFAIRNAKGDQIFPVSPSNSLMYSLCGLGSACSIATGKPSIARGTLVRREILELALYTFKYVSGVNSIVAFMPPKDSTATQYAVLLQKQDLKSELHEPLTDTLGAKTPLPSAIPAREVHVVDATTESRIYTYGVSETQTGDVVFVLTPLPA
jgi:hypothetical protein